MAWTERYVSVAGGGAHDGTTEADAWTLAEAIAAPYAAGQRLNVKAGTYANTTTDRTFGVAGTTTAPIWWRGYNSTIGDLDADFTTAKPAITFTTGGMLVTAAHQWFSNLNISGARINSQMSLSGGLIRVHRCRIENTAANAASSATAIFTNGETQISESWLKATSTATRVAEFRLSSALSGCSVTGGGIGVDLTTAAFTCVIFGNVFNDTGSDGIKSAQACRIFIINNSFYSCGSDGVDLSVAQTSGLIANNIFDSNAAYGINNSSGANTNLITRIRNAFYNNTSGTENGFGDTPSFSEVIESASPFTNAAGADFSLLSTALSKAAGLPGLFENQTYTSYMDIGAVQRVEPSGGGGLIRHPGMTGGLNG